MAGTTPPASGAVAVATKEGWLIAVIPTVIVKVALPQLGDALAIVALELCVRIAGPLVACLLCLIAAVHAVCIPITLPGAMDAAA